MKFIEVWTAFAFYTFINALYQKCKNLKIYCHFKSISVYEQGYTSNVPLDIRKWSRNCISVYLGTTRSTYPSTWASGSLCSSQAKHVNNMVFLANTFLVSWNVKKKNANLHKAKNYTPPKKKKKKKKNNRIKKKGLAIRLTKLLFAVLLHTHQNCLTQVSKSCCMTA